MKVLSIFVFCSAAILAAAKPYTKDLYNANNRITNGQTASTGQFPYQVGLRITFVQNYNAWCGGSLLSETWILTAAHCTSGAKSITAYLGATVRTRPEVTRTVDGGSIIVHSGWNPNNLRNDIALIRIEPVVFSDKIQPIRLPSTAEYLTTYVGAYAVASGWGLDSDKATAVTENLQWARMQIVDNKECSDTYGNSVVWTTLICVATPNGVSTCSGDSGGPLVIESTKTIVGLTSFGASEGCEKGHPAGFTRVSSYLSWIKSFTKIP